MRPVLSKVEFAASKCFPRVDKAEKTKFVLGALVQVEITYRFARGSVFGLFHGFFEFLSEDIFLVRFLQEGVRKLVLTLPPLFFTDARSFRQVHIEPRPHMLLVRE